MSGLVGQRRHYLQPSAAIALQVGWNTSSDPAGAFVHHLDPGRTRQCHDCDGENPAVQGAARVLDGVRREFGSDELEVI